MEQRAQLLDRMGERGGEWYFLKGTICYRRGWVDEARRYYQTACQMEPGNPEFRQALNFVENNQAGYQPEGYEVFSSGCGGDNMCGRLACTYLLYASTPKCPKPECSKHQKTQKKQILPHPSGEAPESPSVPWLTSCSPGTTSRGSFGTNFKK